jgi:leukotriene A-4 hydrolase/aminopeptidase
MRPAIYISYLILLIANATGCSTPEKDLHSFANIEDVKISHIHLSLEVDFENKHLHGFADLSLKFNHPVSEVILDTRDLNIEKVMLNNLVGTDFFIGEGKADFGSPLHIKINDATETIRIYYSTSANAHALQWLSKEQTLGKNHSFLFSQSQSILARSWVPCQDTPANRFTYSAEIKTDPQLLVLMSASNPTEKNPQGIYHFKMEQPVPSYLLAIAVGDLEFRPLGEKCGVYSEPFLIEKAVYEFADTEKMMHAAEELYGPYLWDRFDILVLPPSFPYGGMENPRLTFVTPTIIAGDRSLVSVIAHELAHSWSGNLVTNHYWADFWLNEGFTRYFEFRILEEIYGFQFTTMVEQLGYQSLMSIINRLGENHPDTRLALDLTNRHPDETTSLAYDKGARFLRALEVAYGREKFDRFLKNYFSEFAFQTMTSDKFVKYLTENLIKKNQTNTSQAVKVHEWVYGTGMPDKYPVPQSKEFSKADFQRTAFLSGKPAKDLEVDGWTTQHWLHFLKALPPKVTQNQMADLDSAFKLTSSTNPEIAFAWFRQAIINDYKAAFPALENYLKSIGRLKLIAPLYRALAATHEGKNKALQIYKINKERYHPVTSADIEKILGL